MIREVFVTVLLAIITAGLWLINTQWPNQNLLNTYNTALTITIAYFFFRVLILRAATTGIKTERTVYYVRKATGFSAVVVSLLIAITIWIPNPQSLVVAYGLVGAGIAISLQDYFKSMFGGLLIFFQAPYRIGDRIEIGGRHGDVVDIGILYTTLYELRAWINADQASGRIIKLPNNLLLTNSVHNYTMDSSFIWDEIRLPITLDSNWKRASELATKIAEKQTKDWQATASREFGNMKKKLFISTRDFTPKSFIEVQGNNYILSIRYVASARQRRHVNNEITRAILDRFDKSKDIELGSVSTIQNT